MMMVKTSETTRTSVIMTGKTPSPKEEFITSWAQLNIFVLYAITGRPQLTTIIESKIYFAKRNIC